MIARGVGLMYSKRLSSDRDEFDHAIAHGLKCLDIFPGEVSEWLKEHAWKVCIG
jgi:hypothetical protein